jgi:DNA-3-methyladenine glycosylase II
VAHAGAAHADAVTVALSADNGAVNDGASAAIAAADPAMAAFIARAGRLPDRPAEGDPFVSLARAIVFQQLAGKAAAAIYRRLLESIGGVMAPAALLARAPDELRAAGLSNNKTLALIDLATKATDGSVPLGELAALPDDEIVERLVSVRGIGRWTAEMFLLFELRRPDVWPVDDFGVRNGYSLIHDLPETIKPRALASAGERYRPFRTTAALYCWHAVHLRRGTTPAR